MRSPSGQLSTVLTVQVSLSAPFRLTVDGVSPTGQAIVGVEMGPPGQFQLTTHTNYLVRPGQPAITLPASPAIGQRYGAQNALDQGAWVTWREGVWWLANGPTLSRLTLVGGAGGRASAGSDRHASRRAHRRNVAWQRRRATAAERQR